MRGIDRGGWRCSGDGKRADGSRMPAEDANRGGELARGRSLVGLGFVDAAGERGDREIDALDGICAARTGGGAAGDDLAQAARVGERGGEHGGALLRGEQLVKSRVDL